MVPHLFTSQDTACFPKRISLFDDVKFFLMFYCESNMDLEIFAFILYLHLKKKKRDPNVLFLELGLYVFLTCAENTSHYSVVASPVSIWIWSLLTLIQCRLFSIAFNLICPGLSCTRAKLKKLMGPPTVQLSAHHCCIIHVPGFSTHSPPLAFIEILYSSITTSGSTG